MSGTVIQSQAQVYYPWALQFGVEAGIDANIIMGTIQEESTMGTNPNGLMNTGDCVGVMQVGQSAVSSVNTFFNSVTNQQLYPLLYAQVSGCGGTPDLAGDAEVNIAYGTAYMLYLVKNGTATDTDTMLTAYTTGNTSPASMASAAGYCSDIQGYALQVAAMPGLVGTTATGQKNAQTNFAAGASAAAAATGAGNTAASAAEMSPTAGYTYTANLATNGIMDFISFITNKSFFDGLRERMEQSPNQTLLALMVSFLKKFYHDFLIVPTLPKGKSIMIKPELMFVPPPSCNMIYPAIILDQITEVAL